MRIPGKLWNFDLAGPEKGRAVHGAGVFKRKNRREESGFGSRYLPFGFARFFSWFFLLLILASSVFLALFVARATTSTLLDSQEDYALLLAENLNKQIFNRFTLPVTVAPVALLLGDRSSISFLMMSYTRCFTVCVYRRSAFITMNMR